MVALVFAKKRGKDRQENSEINLEKFISVKGISALGNQLTKEKVLEINAMEPLFYELPKDVPAETIEVIDEENVSPEETPTIVDEDKTEATDTIKEETPKKGEDPPIDPEIDDEGQTLLF
jgi:topoisomerase-4 subunit A